MKNKNITRRIIQIAFFILVALIAVNHGLEEAGYSIPLIGSFSLHAVCPFGSVVSIYQLITTGTLVSKVHQASMVLLYIVILLSILFGPVFCGWLCPLGSIQEWIHKLSQRLGIKKITVPKEIDKYLRFIRYLILVLIVVNTAKAGTLIFTNLDPYYALFNFWTPDFAVVSGIILLVVLVANLFIERAWCKYACPFGALLGLTNFFRLFKIKRQPSTCVSCQLCTKACPMNIDVMAKETVKDHQCISCLECTSEQTCPVDNTVSFKMAKSTKSLKNKTLGIVILLSITGGVVFAMVSGYWSTESSKVPVKLESGEYNPGDIRGSYSFSDIENVFGVPVKSLKEAFMIPDTYDINAFKNKDLETLYAFENDLEIGNGSVKMFVSLYTNIPYDYETAGDYLPLSAYKLLEKNGLIPDEKMDYLKSMLIDLESVTPLDTPVEDERVEEIKVNGSTTFSQLIAWGVSPEDIEAVLGADMPAGNLVIKNYCSQESISFSSIKEALQVLLEGVE